MATPDIADDTSLEDRQALERFVVENEDLERLEALLGRFNIFEAVGVVRQELRHSDFLAFLLDPRQPHGLGDLFLRRLLQRTLRASGRTDLPLSLIDLELGSLADTLVLREVHNVDLLLVNDTHRWVVVIENKIGTGEHSDQLARYLSSVKAHYGTHRILPVYLTPEGDLPTDERYLTLGYSQIVALVDQLLVLRAADLQPDLRLLLEHYSRLLRTHVVSNAEIDDLCLRIYQRHRRALELIYERRPDRQAEVRALVETLIGETDGLVLDQSSKSTIRFGLREWDTPPLVSGVGWTPSRRILLFEFRNRPDALRLRLWIGPGPEPIRAALFRQAGANPIFRLQSRSLNKQWNSIYRRPFAGGSDLEEMTLEDLGGKIRQQWEQFIMNDLPRIQAALDPSQCGQDER